MNAEENRDMIVRYTAGARINHWIVAISFVLVALSGLALFHPALFWLTNLLGGGPWTRILHPFIGCVMIIAFYLFSLGIWRYNFFDKRDWLWLLKVPDVMSNREQNVPEAGRYNAGQKLLFYSIIACLMGLLLSGIVIWRVYFSAFFPIGLIRLASLLHSFCAFVLICSIVVHVYMAIWEKGSMRAMTRGRVSLGWAWKNHRAWFREVTKSAPQK